MLQIMRIMEEMVRGQKIQYHVMHWQMLQDCEVITFSLYKFLLLPWQIIRYPTMNLKTLQDREVILWTPD